MAQTHRCEGGDIRIIFRLFTVDDRDAVLICHIEPGAICADWTTGQPPPSPWPTFSVPDGSG